QDGQGSRGGPTPKHAGDDDTGGVWMSWWVASPAEVDAVHALAVREGLLVTHPPTDEPWCVPEGHIPHPAGHTFRVSAGIEAKCRRLADSIRSNSLPRSGVFG